VSAADHVLAYLVTHLWANLAASAVCSFAVWLKLHREQIARHVQAMAQAAAHHRAQMAQQQSHHDALRAHVDQRLTEHHGRVLAIVSGEQAGT